MNPAMLALGVANPGLLPLAFAGENDAYSDGVLESFTNAFLGTIAFFSFIALLIFCANYGEESRQAKKDAAHIESSVKKFEPMDIAKETKVFSADGRIQNRLEGVVILKNK